MQMGQGCVRIFHPLDEQKKRGLLRRCQPLGSGPHRAGHQLPAASRWPLFFPPLRGCSHFIPVTCWGAQGSGWLTGGVTAQGGWHRLCPVVSPAGAMFPAPAGLNWPRAAHGSWKPKFPSSKLKQEDSLTVKIYRAPALQKPAIYFTRGSQTLYNPR